MLPQFGGSCGSGSGGSGGVVVVTVVVVVVVVVVAVVEARKEIGGRPCTCSRFLLGSFDFSLPTFPIRM